MLIPEAFDTRLLGMPCYRLALLQESLQAGLCAAMRNEFEALPPGALVSVKLPHANARELDGLIAMGARYIDAELVFRAQGPVESHALATGTETAFSPRIDPTPFLDLARDMVHSRFFKDGSLPEDACVTLWRESIANHCQGFADEVGEVSVSGRAAGFTAVRLDGNMARLSIVGVLPAYRGLGLAAALLLQARIRYASLDCVEVEASAGNEAACRAYQKAGFRLAQLRHVLHLRKVTGSTGAGHV